MSQYTPEKLAAISRYQKKFSDFICRNTERYIRTDKRTSGRRSAARAFKEDGK